MVCSIFLVIFLVMQRFSGTIFLTIKMFKIHDLFFHTKEEKLKFKYTQNNAYKKSKRVQKSHLIIKT